MADGTTMDAPSGTELDEMPLNTISNKTIQDKTSHQQSNPSSHLS